METHTIQTIIDYIDNSIDVAVSVLAEQRYNEMKVNNLCEEQNPYAATTYEALLRKEEKEIREHISVIIILTICYYYRLNIN